MTRKTLPSEKIASAAWKTFYQTPGGKAAIAVLFAEFGFFAIHEGDNTSLIRGVGRRDVLARISQLIGLKPDDAPDLDREHEDYITKMMRQSPHV